jgi:hypothetical protein
MVTARLSFDAVLQIVSIAILIRGLNPLNVRSPTTPISPYKSIRQLLVVTALHRVIQLNHVPDHRIQRRFHCVKQSIPHVSRELTRDRFLQRRVAVLVFVGVGDSLELCVGTVEDYAAEFDFVGANAAFPRVVQSFDVAVNLILVDGCVLRRTIRLH